MMKINDEIDLIQFTTSHELSIWPGEKNRLHFDFFLKCTYSEDFFRTKHDVIDRIYICQDF